MSIKLKFKSNPKIVDYLGRIGYLFIGRKDSMLFDKKLFETYQRFFDIDDNFMFKLDDDEEHEVRLVEERGVTNAIYERTIESIIHLMQEKYRRNIKCIYIDPPYNTGNKDFIYNDSYVDKEDSYRHSKWLSFMNRRLKIAKKLLSDRGIIFISIDDNRVYIE